MKLRNFLSLLVVCIMAIPIGALPNSAKAQIVDINWQNPINLSNSVATSTDPFILADPTGIAHLFWAEKTGSAPGNQADTIMYTCWDGNSWSEPLDLYISPLSDGNPVASYPRATLDERGTIHLIWMTLPNFPNHALMYRRVSAWQAKEINAWSPPQKLAHNLTGQQYSADIAYSPEQGLHILYARGTGGREGRAISYIFSNNAGETWSNPVDIHAFLDPGRGGSNIRVILEPPNRIYATWTEWDFSGNGQAVYFTYSENNGEDWVVPFTLSVRIGNDYERDWNNLALLGPNQLVSIWEGGFRAYRGAMYSYDGGKTWTKPFDVFPTLIGDNGKVQFVHDSKGRLHLFIANRIREGYVFLGDRLGLWHSAYLGDERWSTPKIASVYGLDTNITNPSVTIVKGNTIIAVWYGSQIYEIIAMIGEISDAPEIPPTDWLIPTVSPIISATTTETNNPSEEFPPRIATSYPQFNTSRLPSNPGNVVYLSIIPSIIIIISMFFLRNRQRNR